MPRIHLGCTEHTLFWQTSILANPSLPHTTWIVLASTTWLCKKQRAGNEWVWGNAEIKTAKECPLSVGVRTSRRVFSFVRKVAITFYIFTVDQRQSYHWIWQLISYKRPPWKIIYSQYLTYLFGQYFFTFFVIKSSHNFYIINVDQKERYSWIQQLISYKKLLWKLLYSPYLTYLFGEYIFFRFCQRICRIFLPNYCRSKTKNCWISQFISYKKLL